MPSRRDQPITDSQPRAAELDGMSAPLADEAQPSSSALLKRARDALVAAGEPLNAAQLAPDVFGAASSPLGLAAAGPWAILLDKLLAPSPLFTHDGAGQWRLAAWDIARRSLPDVEFVAIDVETTGLAPGRHRLIEVGAVIITGGEIGASFRKFVNPDRRIPQFITKFSGITDSMVGRAAHAGSVLPKLRDFIGERPIVGHNVGFDLSFLNFEADRCGMGTAFPDEGIDTIALARRFVTGLRRASLDRVALALHLPVNSRHRALPDAMLTAQVFALLLARAREE
ncbi:MAG TPA: 3'-5' exonuclease, partial [Ktedonobacterales bacterium]|nr:3'-5' exonuclease [Ktedonobacterales bacterium]